MSIIWAVVIKITLLALGVWAVRELVRAALETRQIMRGGD